MDAQDPGKTSTNSAYCDGVHGVNDPELGSKSTFTSSPHDPDMVDKVVEIIAIFLDDISKCFLGAQNSIVDQEADDGAQVDE